MVVCSCRFLLGLAILLIVLMVWQSTAFIVAFIGWIGLVTSLLALLSGLLDKSHQSDIYNFEQAVLEDIQLLTL